MRTPIVVALAALSLGLVACADAPSAPVAGGPGRAPVTGTAGAAPAGSSPNGPGGPSEAGAPSPGAGCAPEPTLPEPTLPEPTLPEATLPGAAGVPGSAVGSGPSAGAGAEAVLTPADDGRSICLLPGQRLAVRLPGTAAAPWSAVTVRGGALVPVGPAPSPVGGSVDATYLATRAGVATVSASRPVCPSPAADRLGCHGLRALTVTVTVD
ncbi:hypothetical protein [Plantactinospora sp. KBS50]|uniref:hypothetical protein n=1 Tax=Plantactinospora sp. KBS50 TaxID=2024580 RepID=UPI000BAAC3F9|nr:hypothetical protein [Plantactinospora sp. KBS50]ASW54206.1 hypothetical protein CIK06_08350 [Plantactinospora sp. KBS50]